MIIDYKKLWKLLIDRGMNKGDLRKIAGIGSGTLAKLGKNENVTTDVLLKICDGLKCDIIDILEIRDEKYKEDIYSRPIKEKPFTYIDLFAGIGGIRIPFDELGYRNVFASEWDNAACDTYEANFGERPHGDITKIDAKDIPSHDLLLAGFPCQAFSIMGKMQGFGDIRGTMFFEIARILDYHKPQAILLENVKQLVTHDHKRTFSVILNKLKQLGYHVKWEILNALDFGVPQKRERTIIVGFRDKRKAERFEFKFDKVAYNLSNIIETDDKLDKSLFVSNYISNKRKEKVKDKNIFYPSIWHENKSGNISILPYACALRTGASYNYQLINGCRRPSPRELLRLQGFPDSYKIVVSHQEIRRQTGNSVAVPMIRFVAQKINQELIRHEY